jgi:hypothetical protein
MLHAASVRSQDLGTVLLAVTLVAMAWAPRIGQAQSFSTTATAAECREAIAALKARTPPAPGPGSSAWWVAPSCGAKGGRALASAATSLATSADTAVLRDAELALGDIRDAAIFQSAKALSTNASATSAARIMALRVLLAQLSGGFHLPTPVSMTPEGRRCAPRHLLARDASYRGASLPPDFAQQAFMAAKQVATSNASTEVRLVAQCVQEIYSAFVPPDVDPSLLRLTYLCGNKFRVRNANPDWADVRYEVANTDDDGEYEVPPDGEITIETGSTGLTLLYYDDKVVQKARNRRVACTS